MSQDLTHTALVVMDVQNGIVSRFANQEDVLRPYQHALAAARRQNMPVIFVRIAFREGYPEVSPHNKAFSAVTRMGGLTTADFATQIPAAMQPQPDEPVVTKLRVSAFAGSDLEILLRARQIDALVLCGIATGGVVLSTVREAADKDFALTVLSDACFDADPEVHRVLMEKVFPRQADVMTVAEWVDTLA